MKIRRLDADVPERWDDLRLNDAIVAQLLGLGRIPGPDLELPEWTGEMLRRLRSSEARLVSGETLGADPHIPGGYIASFLRVFKQYTQDKPTGFIGDIFEICPYICLQ